MHLGDDRRGRGRLHGALDLQGDGMLPWPHPQIGGNGDRQGLSPTGLSVAHSFAAGSGLRRAISTPSTNTTSGYSRCQRLQGFHLSLQREGLADVYGLCATSLLTVTSSSGCPAISAAMWAACRGMS